MRDINITTAVAEANKLAESLANHINFTISEAARCGLVDLLLPNEGSELAPPLPRSLAILRQCQIQLAKALDVAREIEP